MQGSSSGRWIEIKKIIGPWIFLLYDNRTVLKWAEIGLQNHTLLLYVIINSVQKAEMYLFIFA